MTLEEKFFQAYANIPLNIRQEIVVVVGNEPFSWSAAKIEIENKTAKGKEILEKLANMGIINND
ncbi:MAG TPA: hypothetical protein VMW29_03210 [Candidatus Bathyarchaeia archaeon]|nr:hypothetical protein [Candidatus Bathyarchaeia archaeon]